MPVLRYDLQVWPAGVQTTTGAPAFTLKTQLGAGDYVVPGQLVRPGQGQVESQSMQVTVVDVGSTFTAKLASTAGRMWLLNRIARLRVAQDSTASSAYKALATPRITDVSLAEDVASYRLTLADERHIERNTELFGRGGQTCSVVPEGLISDWFLYRKSAIANWTKAFVVGNVALLKFAGPQPAPKSSLTAQLMMDDLRADALAASSRSTRGNFTYARFWDAGAGRAHQVLTWDESPVPVVTPPLNTYVEYWRSGEYLRQAPHVWVLDTSGLLGSNPVGYVYMPGHPTTAALPTHVGLTSTGAGLVPLGQHPFQIVQDIYDGIYNTSTGGAKVRYDPAAFTALKADPRYGPCVLRMTQTQTMADLLDQRFYGPLNVAPFLDSSGRISPRSLNLPRSSETTFAKLPILTAGTTLAATLRFPHPTFEHPLREAITVLQVQEPQTHDVSEYDIAAGNQSYACDRIWESTVKHERIHDKVALFGRRVVSFQLPIAMGSFGGIGLGLLGPTRADQLVDSLARELFDRFGDGPIASDMACLPIIDAQTTLGKLRTGQFVKVSLPTFPNPATLTRGGDRIMQLISRTETPVGPTFRVLDAGPYLQATSAPSVAIVKSTQGVFTTRSAVKITISNLLSGAQYVAQIAISTSTGSTTPPASSANSWRVAGTGTTAQLVFYRTNLPAQNKIWARARSAAPRRIRSAWSAAAGVVLASIPAPTSPKTTSITGGAAVAKWKAGVLSSKYPVELMFKNSTAAGLTSTQRIAALRAGTVRYTIHNLTTGQKYRWGVRAFDPAGGHSAFATTTFTAGASKPIAARPRHPVLIYG